MLDVLHSFCRAAPTGLPPQPDGGRDVTSGSVGTKIANRQGTLVYGS